MIHLEQKLPTLQVQTLDPYFMLIGIGAALLLVAVTHFILKRSKHSIPSSYLARAMISVPEIMQIQAKERESAIHELVRFASRLIRSVDEETLVSAVLRREQDMSTGLVRNVAVPHARLSQLDHSIVLFGRSDRGIPWDCLDGQPAKLIFLILSPEDNAQEQLHMLAEIGHCADDNECLELLRTAKDCRVITRAIEAKVSDRKRG